MRIPLLLLVLLVRAAPAGAQVSRARADSAWRVGNRELARREYAAAIAANPFDSHAAFRLGQLSSRPGEALLWYERYAALEPDDPWGWMALGDQQARMGRAGAARESYDQAARLAPGNPDVAAGRARLGARAPALLPTVEYQRDSDGNRTQRVGVEIDWATGATARLGLGGSVARIGDASVTHRMQEGGLRLTVGSARNAQFTLRAGGVRIERGTSAPWFTPVGQTRFRLRAGRSGAPALDLRAERVVLGATPTLLENQAVRNEARGLLELPLGPLRLRGGGRVGAIRGLGEHNTRWGGDGMLVLPLGWRTELSAQVHRLQYRHPSSLGYFAPARVETLEGGLYTELGGRATLALDLGSGVQRLRQFAAGPGPWRLALRGWAALTVPFAPGRELRLESEGYDAPFAPEGVASANHWRSLALSAGIRWAFR